MLHIAGLDDVIAKKHHLDQVLNKLPTSGPAVLMVHEPIESVGGTMSTREAIGARALRAFAAEFEDPLPERAFWQAPRGPRAQTAQPLGALCPGAGVIDRPGVGQIPLAALVVSTIILLAGFKMKGLEAWRLAVAGSILAVITTPGNIIGLPLGIWSLVVLMRRETRDAFAARAIGRLGPAPVQPGGSGWKWGVVALAGVLILLLAIPTGGILLGIVLPALSRAKAARNQATPNFVVTGKVTDADTDKPIAGARVADNFYGSSPTRASQETWTDETGHYQLKTWYEEHAIVASASGYDTKVNTLLTSFGGRQTTGKTLVASNDRRQTPAVIDFRLERTSASATLPEAPVPVQPSVLPPAR